jgi:FHS family glucose/mannose:H+ symporter-like MFS transporter
MNMDRRLIVFLSACLGMLLFGVTLITLGSVATVLRERLALSAMDAGMLFSILPFGILFSSLVFGTACRRFGYGSVLSLSAFLVFLGFQGIAYAYDLDILRASVFVFGLGGGVLNGVTNAVVSDVSTDRKAANLSLLGIFFGLGALGMPLLLGLLSKRFEHMQIVSGVGWVAAAAALIFLFVPFPKPEAEAGKTDMRLRDLLSPLLLYIGFFLFFQSSLEAVINNWATTYVTSRGVMEEKTALYALSLHMAGMVAMRVVMGWMLRKVSETSVLVFCLVFIAAGLLLMTSRTSSVMVTAGLVITGAGLAGGFPILLGVAGQAHAAFSASAFSVVFTIALTGNMLVNYLMGWVVERFGIDRLIALSLAEVVCMAVLLYLVHRNTSTPKKQ